MEQVEYCDVTPSHDQAIKMRQFSASGKFGADVIESIMYEDKPNQREKINISMSRQESTFRHLFRTKQQVFISCPDTWRNSIAFLIALTVPRESHTSRIPSQNS